MLYFQRKRKNCPGSKTKFYRTKPQIFITVEIIGKENLECILGEKKNILGDKISAFLRSRQVMVFHILFQHREHLRPHSQETRRR